MSRLNLHLLLWLALGCSPGSQANPLAGGFASAQRKDPQVIKAANFAIAERNQQAASKLVLKQILQAQTQVVAGLNFKLCLKVKQTAPLQTITVQATVYQNLEQKMELSLWQVVPSCPRAGQDIPKPESAK